VARPIANQYSWRSRVLALEDTPPSVDATVESANALGVYLQMI
jgi:hypothetical protein